MALVVARPGDGTLLRDIEIVDDDALVVALRDGQDGALAEVCRRYGGAVWAASHRVCCNPSLAEEICQVVFTELWCHPDRYATGRGGLRGWLVSQAHGRAVDAVRSEVARRRREERVARLAPTVVEDVEAAVALGGLARKVRGALDQLAEPQRRAILLTYYGGHTWREAARILDVPEGTIKSRIRLGLGALRRALTDQGLPP